MMNINELLKKLLWREPYTTDQAYHDGIAFEHERIIKIIKNVNGENRFDWLIDKINGG